MKSKLFLLCTFLVGLFSISSIAAEFNHSGVAIMYHRFGENDYPSTNIRVEQLKEHIQELTSGKYNVMRLDDMMATLQKGEKLPNRSVAITIDDAFVSVFNVGWPMFKEAGLPVTLFMSAGPVDQGQFDYMTWDQIRQMAAEGADIQGHSLNHSHLPLLPTQQAFAEIEEDHARITEELGKTPTLFAYPYGEASKDLMDYVQELGYKAAFGQHSGAMTPMHNQFYLPRFPVNERYGEFDRFKMSINAVGLPATDYLPMDPLLYASGPKSENNPPHIGFTLPADLKRANELACYHSQVGKIEDMQRIGSRRIELRFNEKFPKGRTRVNCTLPAADNRWYWYGMQFFTK
ncbi:chitin deacetylase [Rhodospirillaceae bacterium RKSG073]|nr:chitin deacetylase [Curvivirga aplysinae]